jgi:hypothetical protein
MTAKGMLATPTTTATASWTRRQLPEEDRSGSHHGDGKGDACKATTTATDLDAADNCPKDANAAQVDTDRRAGQRLRRRRRRRCRGRGRHCPSVEPDLPTRTRMARGAAAAIKTDDSDSDDNRPAWRTTIRPISTLTDKATPASDAMAMA